MCIRQIGINADTCVFSHFTCSRVIFDSLYVEKCVEKNINVANIFAKVSEISYLYFESSRINRAGNLILNEELKKNLKLSRL